MGCCSVKFGHVSLEPRHPTKPREIRVSVHQFVERRHSNVEETYELEQELGRGSFGKVVLGRHRELGVVRAIKTIAREGNECAGDFCAEVEILKKIDHPNVMKVFELYEDTTSFHLVTEFVEGGPLFEMLEEFKQLPEQVASDFTRQLLAAVAYCHSNGIVHRDLKLENVLLDSRSFKASIKVIDFGLSTLLTSNQRLTQQLGSAYYMAPEVFDGDYDEKCDIWSCGVLVFAMLSGKLPFTGFSTREVMYKVKEGNPSFSLPAWAGISREAAAFTKRLLCSDPELRMNAAAALQDPWLTSRVTTKEVELMTLTSLSSFPTTEKLQHAVLTVIASHLGKTEEANQLRQEFSSIDKNSDGRLSKEEICAAYAVHGNTLTLQEVCRILDQIDIDGSGFIDFTEFLMACMRSDNFTSEANLKYAFKLFDIDNSQTISAAEIRRVLGREVEASEQVWSEILMKVDKNHDGEIDFEEFKGMIHRLLESNH
jgi:calcium-dependent protein kinase